MAKQKKKGGIKPWMYVVAGLGVIAALAINVSRKVYVKSIKVRIPKIDFAKVTLRLAVEIVNNSGVGLPIDAITGVLKYGNDPISGVNLPTSVVIKGNQSTTLDLDLIVPFQNLSEQVIKLFKDGTWYRYIYFEGHIVSKGVMIPIKQNIQIL